MNVKQIKPTESELEILQVLWQKKKASVREVHEALEGAKDVGYTTTLKLMQIMHEKGLVTRDDSARTHIYKPAIEKKPTQNALLSKLIHNVFDGSYAQLVISALGSHEVSATELTKIEDLIKNLKSK